MIPETRACLHTEFIINDQANGYPKRPVTTTASREELDELARTGFLLRRNVLSGERASELAEAVLRLAAAEESRPESECLSGRSIYLRALLDKDAAFHPLLQLEPVLSIARSLLGPQVWIDLEARMNYAGTADVAVPWHGHTPVIPEPVPAFFCYPHQIHALIYLDRITEQEGALCLLPGSHVNPMVRIPLGDHSYQDGQVELYFNPGDAVLIHGNLWHRTIPSRPGAGYRRLLLLGYVPSWIRPDIGLSGVRPTGSLRSELAAQGDTQTRELLGEFSW
jgi:ectoine hydroxylase-related dioxygenase (phytanoyl-CoA dioxygenase family)